MDFPLVYEMTPTEAYTLVHSMVECLEEQREASPDQLASLKAGGF